MPKCNCQTAFRQSSEFRQLSGSCQAHVKLSQIFKINHSLRGPTLIGQIQNRAQIEPVKISRLKKSCCIYRTALNDLSSFGLYFFNTLTNINDKSLQKKVLLFHPLIVMKVPSGVEWYNILILGLALIGIVVNISCLVLLVKRRKCSMFYTLIKVKLMYLFLLIISLTNQVNN